MVAPFGSRARYYRQPFISVKLKNWALKKPATQSSTPKKTGAARNAVDGLAYTCSVTKRQQDPWCMVDLQQVVLVYAVAVTNVTTGQFLVIVRFTM